MAIRLGNKLGIEFHQSELRVFEVKARGNDLIFGCVGAIPMDLGYLMNGVIVNPELVGERLRVFLDRQKVSAVDVVASFPSDNCVTRVLNLPRAPESEIRSLINGEVEHFGLVRQGGVYDYFRLSAPPKEGIGISVLFVATEGMVITSVDRTLECAGLRLVALEPTHVALFRSAFGLATRTENSLFLTISEHRTDLSLVHDGKVSFYRTFEVGANELAKVQAAESMFPDVEDSMSLASRLLNLEAASSLAIEIRRSIDYFNREMPDAPNLTRIVVSSNTPAIHPIGDWLQEATGLETEFVRLSHISLEGGANFSQEDGVRFLTCYGLAIRDSQTVAKDLPRMDLSLHEQMVSALEQSDKKLRIGAYFCAGLIVASMVGTSLGVMRARRAADELAAADKDLVLIKKVEKQRLEELDIKGRRLALLEQQGLPVNKIILGIGRSLPTQAGIQDVKLSAGKADISGQAKTEEAMVQFTRSLQMNSFVTNVSLASFERLFEKDGSSGIRFQMSVSTATPTPPTLTGAANTEVKQ